MIAVVGATGFIGSALTRRLLGEQGTAEPVRVLVRDQARAAARLEEAGARVPEMVVGDMHDDAALDALLTGARAVYVLAQTVTARQPAGSGDFADAERRATQRLVAAAHRASVRRLLTVGLIGAGPDAANPWVRSRVAVERQLLVDVVGRVVRDGLAVEGRHVRLGGAAAAR